MDVCFVFRSFASLPPSKNSTVEALRSNSHAQNCRLASSRKGVALVGLLTRLHNRVNPKLAAPAPCSPKHQAQTPPVPSAIRRALTPPPATTPQEAQTRQERAAGLCGRVRFKASASGFTWFGVLDLRDYDLNVWCIRCTYSRGVFLSDSLRLAASQ